MSPDGQRQGRDNRKSEEGYPAGANRRPRRRWRPPVWFIVVIVIFVIALALSFY
jgi:hypothetical protein